jgi:hypothetical protein
MIPCEPVSYLTLEEILDAIKVVLKFWAKMHKPSGKTDSGSRWSPSDEEQCSCCGSIRSPSRAYPWSLLKHCHSKKHIKNLIQENPTHLSKDTPEALAMTIETAPQYINSESALLIYVRDELLGINKT